MRQRTRNALLLLVLALSQSVSARSTVQVPDWVEQAAAKQPGAYSSQTPAVILLEQRDYTVLGSGDFIEHSRSVWKILRPEGRKDAEELEVYLRNKDKLQSVHAWTIDKARETYEVKDKEFIEESGYPDWVLYADDRSFTAKAPAALPGSVIAFEYTAVRHNWINELGWRFQGRNPIVEAVITLQLPANWEYRASWAHVGGVDPAPLQGNRWQWTLRDVPGIAEEPERMMPALSGLAGRVSISYFGPGESAAHSASWEQVGRWYGDLTDGRYKPTPDIAAEVQKLIADKPDFPSRLQALAFFVQSQIRYVAVEIGVGGEQPHFASDVFRYRYGDCKDKATLLKAMLQEAGIPSHYVLIHTDRGFIVPDVPSSWANHAIIAIELPEGEKHEYASTVRSKTGRQLLIFDPTDEYTPVGLLRAELQNSFALLVTDTGGELIRTPLLPPKWNQVTRTGKFVLSKDGDLVGEVSELRNGDLASYERAKLHYKDQRVRTVDLERWLGRSLQGFTVEDVNIEGADQLAKDVIVHYRLTVPQYAKLRATLMLVRARVLDEKSTPVEHKPRLYPVDLQSTTRQIDTYEIEIPKEYEVDDIPNPTTIDVGFAAYRSKIEADGRKLRYWREYEVRDVTIPPEKYADWTRLQGFIGADENAAVVLKKVD
jgi:hypothetical protein